MRKLVVTADDFGAAPEVNEAVERAHRDGILSAASLMVSGAAAADAVARAQRMPSLRVGLHLVIVEGRPILPARAVPDLVDAHGFFRTEMARAGAAIYFLPAVKRQLAHEIEAQFDAFRAAGLALDHVNAHKHFHLHPTVADLLVAIGRNFGLKAARVPLEPRRILARIEATPFSPLAALTSPFAHGLRRRLVRAGIAAPDQVFGLRWSGAMTMTRLASLLEHLPEGLSEIYCHPAIRPYPGSVSGYCYGDELAALTDAGVKAALVRGDIRLGGFSDFPVQ